VRALLGQFDGVTWAAAATGLVTGLTWLVSLPVGLGLTGVLAPIGAILLVLRLRWLEVGLLATGIGLVPSLAYRWFGPPAIEPPLREDLVPLELIAPSAAYLLVVIGLLTTFVVGIFELREGRRRERQEASHDERRRMRISDGSP
jgi:hypothetical protein